MRELYGVMAAEGATGGFVVTSGIFTHEAPVFARGRNIELIDGKQLAAMIDKARSTVRPIASSAKTPSFEPKEGLADRRIEPEPSCPRCGSLMVRRAARQGTHAGASFWGCSRYPQCRGTRPGAP